MSRTRMARRTTRLAGLATAAGIAIALVGCAGGPEGNEGDLGTFDYLAPNENSTIRDAITILGENECAAEQEAMPLKVETLPQGDVNQRVTLLASQNALPEMFIAPTAAIRPTGPMGDDETTLNLEETLKELGVYEDILPAAIATVENIYGGRFVSMPYQFNVEGFFYNKDMFAELGLEEPQTWGEWLAASDAIQASGKQPFVVSGDQAWTILRYVGNYIFRDLGPDAMLEVTSGNAKLTDPEYVAGIEEIAKLQKYLGPGVSTMDVQTAISQLLTGEAGMMYFNSALLADIYNEELNSLGPDAFGFMPFPAVEGGAGSIDQYPANAGAATSFSTALYNDGVGDWITCIAQNYGSSAMNNLGLISGFRLNQPVDDVPELTAQIQEILAGVTETVTWFEASMGQRGMQAAGENAVPLITGSMSAQEFAELVQSAIDADLAAAG